MAVDCGIELRKHNVCMLSLYPGAVRTELVTSIIGNQNKTNQGGESSARDEIDSYTTDDKMMKRAFEKGESIEYSGKVVVQMAQDPKIMNYTSRVVLCAEVKF